MIINSLLTYIGDKNLAHAGERNQEPALCRIRSSKQCSHVSLASLFSLPAAQRCTYLNSIYYIYFGLAFHGKRVQQQQRERHNIQEITCISRRVAPSPIAWTSHLSYPCVYHFYCFSCVSTQSACWPHARAQGKKQKVQLWTHTHFFP